MQSECTELLEQGSDEWLAMRCGKITASRFKPVMSQPRSKTAKERGDLSDAATSLMLEIVGEIITGQKAELPTTKEMKWGIDNEPKARELFEIRYGEKVDTTGFHVWPENDMVGCSPDGLIGHFGGLEIKCCYTSREHMRHILCGIPEQYLWQINLSMLVTGREWWTFVSYDPRIDDIDQALFRIRVDRDEETMTRMHCAIDNFTRHVKANVEKVKACLQR